MIRLLTLVTLVLLMTVGYASADIIVYGPPDDPTEVEDTVDIIYPGEKASSILPGLPSGYLRGADTASGVNLSGLDCSGFPIICFYVDILDSAGNPIPGLTDDSLCVYQDGVPIDSFSVEQLNADSCVTSVCLVVDVSASMLNDHKIDSAKSAMHRFVNNMDPFDRVAIVAFSTCIQSITPFTSNQATLHAAINALSATGATALSDGIWKGVDLTKTELGSKAVIAFTDGLDNASYQCYPPTDGINDGTYADDSTLICNLATSAGIPIYTFNVGPLLNTWYNPEMLVAFSSGTGGFWTHAPSAADIDSVYSYIKERLCSRYYVCYSSLDTVQNGDWHTTTVCYFDGMTCAPCDSSECQEMDAPGIDLTPPTVELSDTCQPYNTPIDICVNVVDLDTPGNQLTVTLFYRTMAGSYTSVTMNLTGPGDTTFCATISSALLACNSFLDYYITASDGQATVSSPAVNPQASPYRVDICPTSPPVAFAGNDTTVFQCTPAPICWPASATDVDGNLESADVVTGPGTFNGSQICFTPSQTLDYEIVLEAVDSCGYTDYDTVVVHYVLNTAPTADAGPDSSLFLCDPVEVCLPAGCTDAEGNLLSCTLIDGAGTYNGSEICFTPDTAGTYRFILEAEDDCGLVDVDTSFVSISYNSDPVCTVPDDTSFSQCTPTQVCLPFSVSDADNNLDNCQIVSGQGSLVGGQWCYTPTSDQTVNVTIRCTDSCGAFCESTFSVQFQINDAPTISLGADTSVFLCTSEEICIPFQASDPNAGQSSTVTVVSGTGSLNIGDSTVCFTPASSGVYTLIARVEDSCGAADQDTVNVTVTFNTAPLASAGADQTLFLCASQEICWAASCSDVDNNLQSCTLTGPGTYNGTNICFTPVSSGTYDFILTALDACGETHEDTVSITVTLNSPPSITLQADTSVFQCDFEEICVSYTTDDPDGLTGSIERMVSGVGAIDTLANEVCFVPSGVGSYEIVVEVEDECGEIAADTVFVTVTTGEVAVIDCPADTIDVSLCGPDQVCAMLDIQPSTATVSVSQGTYANGELCVQADTTGVYVVQVIADEQCGSDTCEVVFNVDIGQQADIECPGPQVRFKCGPSQVCVPLTVLTPGATVTVSPIGTYSGGNICFFADTSGHYELTVVASTECGDDSCVIEVDVTLNSNPVAVDEASPIDTFLCVAGQICHQLDASDADGGNLVWTRLSGNGTITTGGLWCFDAAAGQSYSVTAVVTDSCGAADTTTVTYNVSLNQAPTIALGADTTVFLCGSEEICLPYTVADIDGNIALEEVLSGAATLDTANNLLCFTPGQAGVFDFTVGVTDDCGAVGQDQIQVTVEFNSPPMANAGADQSIFQCDLTEVCWAATCTDPDGNINPDSCRLVSGPGTFDGSQICFTPGSSGTFTFILEAQDVCGETDQDTVSITIELNSPPVCNIPGDTSFFQCQVAQVSLPVSATDPDGNFDRCEIVSGPGSLQGGNWQFTPSTEQPVTVVIQCLDSCGAACVDTFTVGFQFNDPPVASAGPDSTFFLCGAGQICWNVSATDPNNNLQTVELLSTPGTYNSGTGQICINVPLGNGNDRTYTVVLRATDSCGVSDTDTSLIHIDFNSPPVIDPPSDFTAFMESLDEICFPVDITDPDNNLNNVQVSPPGVYANGQICFTPDTAGAYCFEIIAIDACGAMDTDTVCATIQLDECLSLQIEKVHDAIQGHWNSVDVYLNGGNKEIGGFDLLISYDESAIIPGAVNPGPLVENCGWEYFDYRYGAEGNCDGCPSGLLRIVGIAETNNGAYHPGCYLDGQVGAIAEIEFLISNDRNLQCQYVPIEFFWLDCSDNSLSSRNGDTLIVAREVFSFELVNITNHEYGFPGKYGVPQSCLAGEGPGKPVPIRCVDFTNGGVDIICADSIDDRGDLNLNGIAYEIADAVIFTQYFLVGLSAFGQGLEIEAAIAASEVNGDGVPLTVADLVYLIRVITGDLSPNPKELPASEAELELAVVDNLLSIASAGTEVGALYLVFDGRVNPRLHPSAAPMELRTEHVNDETRVLIFHPEGASFMTRGPVLYVESDHVVTHLEASDFFGNALNVSVSSLPDRFELMQNYPNPFNPTTTIEFALPTASDWRLTIFNILGQRVDEMSGRAEAGFQQVEWDAGRYASGVYFYRLEASSFTKTRKMLLLK